ncbi:MAG: hypothetical protein KDB23_12130 [Planctomycetales bacterium]|nr:hypothetical protein [Planctomycetales bacterium]
MGYHRFGQFFQAAFAFGAVLAASCVSSYADSIVIPSEFTNKQGPSTLGTVSPGNFRFHIVYDAQEFPPQRVQITQLAVRPKAIAQAAAPLYPDLTVSLATTTEQLLPNLDANLQAANDVTVVFQGDLETSSDGPTGASPRPFDFTIPLSTPFTYHPSEGNLFVDFDAPFAFSEPPQWDAAPAGGRVILSINGVAQVDSRYPIMQFEFTPIGPLGDFDGNNALDAVDIDTLTAELLAPQHDHSRPSFDLNGDKVVDQQDHQVWIKDLRYTWFGDANLDGEFNSTDLIVTFGAGEYEDDIPGNSGWAEGDWNADGDFDTSDLIVAFADGGYEQGVRAAIQAVPEPSCAVLAVTSLLALSITRGRVRCQHRVAV